MASSSFRGRVVRKLLGAGTKSEHEALVLVTDAGEYRLRRLGGNPFWDEALAPLEGKRVECTGTVRDGVLLLERFAIVKS